jgi:hypothetical protein
MTNFDLDWKRYYDALAIANNRTKEAVFDALRDGGITLGLCTRIRRGLHFKPLSEER